MACWLLPSEQETIAAAAAQARHAWNPAGSSRTAPRSTTSAYSSARPAWSGIPLAQLPLPAGFPAHLLHVRRYDMDIVPTPDLMLEFGDRVGVLMPPDAGKKSASTSATP